MKRILTGVGICVVLATPLGAHWNDPPATDSQPDPQRQQPTVVNEPDGSQRVTIALSDPDKPATLEMNIVMGNIMVKGVNRKDVLIEAKGPGATPASRRANDEPPPAGLRRLTQGTPFSVEEDKNTISVDAGPTRVINFIVEVPLHTNLDVETVHGSVSVEAVDGELEVDSVNGQVTLTNVGGCVVAHSVNGKLAATVIRINPQQPMAFTSMNGTVDVTLPAAVKANLKLRSDQGDVYTDFDFQEKADATASANANSSNGRRSDRNGRTSINFEHSIYGTVNGGGPDFEIRTFNGNVYVRKGK